MENFIFGGFSGIVGQTTSYPFDIVRRRMQTDKLPQDLGVFKALLQIARSEGFIGGWYKGLSMNWIKGPISTGIVFSTYDMIFAFTKDLLHRRWNGEYIYLLENSFSEMKEEKWKILKVL